MRAESGYGSSRPGRAHGAGAPTAPRPGSRHDLDPAKLEALLGPIVRAAGLDLESVKIGRAGRRRLLRVVVDADGGVSLDDIALVSREASVRLDDTGAMGEAPYTLEVSSPGVDRPLTQPRHWRRAMGRLVRVPLAGSGNPGPGNPGPGNPGPGNPGPGNPGPGNPGPGDPGPGAEAQAAPVEGRVVAAGDNGVILEVDGEHLELGYAELGPGQVQVEFGRPAADPGGQDAARASAATGPRTGGRADGH
jgi:ribosome maturation factor RimP